MPPPPNVTCGLSARVMSKRNGSSNASSSRFADGCQIVTRSPAAIGTPRISVSTVAVRRKYATGEVQRRISSTAVLITAGSPAQELELIGMLDERHEPGGDRVAGRLAPGDREHEEEEIELESA